MFHSLNVAGTVVCGVDSVSVRVLLNIGQALPLDPKGFLLGSCSPSTGSYNTVQFQSGLLDCRFMRMEFSAPRTSSLFFLGSPINIAAAVKQQFYMPLMVYVEECVAASTPELSLSSQTYPLIANHGLSGWTPPVYNPALGDASGFGKLEFTMGIMNEDFSAPRTSSLFFLGSPINIAAAVKQQFHMPLMVYVEECVAASTPELSPSSQTYPLIANHGCFVDSQAASSRFLPRVQTSEIRLVVQAFKFTQLNTDVSI
ncbi:UNVERIFIED_CONTAM: hypothetical protein FKN15_058504 [Acipenser sinensis]